MCGFLFEGDMVVVIFDVLDVLVKVSCEWVFVELIKLLSSE